MQPVLQIPIIELIELYPDGYLYPNEITLLKGSFLDTRAEIRRMTLRREVLRKRWNTLRSNLSANDYESKDRLEKIFYPKITSLEKGIDDLTPVTLKDLAKEDPYYYRRPNLLYIEIRFMRHPQFLGFSHVIPDNITIPEAILKIREVELVLHKVILWYLEKDNFPCQEIQWILKRRRAWLDYYRATKETLLLRISEEVSFSELKSKIRHFSQSRVRDQYFEKLLSLAKTKEDLFFVVKHGLRCPCWPKAVRKLARLKNLSPIEKIK